MASTTNSIQQSPLAYFVAGLIVSASYFYLSVRRKNGCEKVNIEEGWDDDSEEEDHDANHPLLNTNNPASSWGYMDAPYKMVFCVNQDLGMGKGKWGSSP